LFIRKISASRHCEKKNKKFKIGLFVTGSSGYIGTELIKHLNKKEFEIVEYD
jgi:hypothetical protein